MAGAWVHAVPILPYPPAPRKNAAMQTTWSRSGRIGSKRGSSVFSSGRPDCETLLAHALLFQVIGPIAWAIGEERGV